jgi:hypothetical protein
VVANSLDTFGGAMATALADQLKARQLKVVGKFALSMRLNRALGDHQRPAFDVKY